MDTENEEIERVNEEVLDAIDDAEETTEPEAPETEEETEVGEEAGEPEGSEEPAFDAEGATAALSERIEALEADIALLRDSIAALVEDGMVIREGGDDAEDVADDETLLLEDLDYD
jgi:hypothetical protein